MSEALDSSAAAPEPSAQAVAAPQPTGRNKRIFAFQKRWLNTLPIAERTSTEYLKTSTNGPVVVCMLCEENVDPNDKLDRVRTWDRHNVRRGRIETHLHNKHPQAMTFLRFKLETQGEFALQMFLTEMREGKVNVSKAMMMAHTHGYVAEPTFPPEMQEEKRAREDMMEMNDVKRQKTEEVPARADPMDVMDDQDEQLEVENDHLEDAQHPLGDKLIIVTGGDDPKAAELATSLFVKGANVFLLFTASLALDKFTKAHQARFGDQENGMRGELMPKMLQSPTGSLDDEFSRFIQPYSTLDALITYTSPLAYTTTDQSHISNPYRALSFCDIVRNHCFRSTKRGRILNIVQLGSDIQSQMDVAAVEALSSAISSSSDAMHLSAATIVLDGQSVPVTSLADTSLFLLRGRNANMSASVVRLSAKSSDTTVELPEVAQV